MTMEMIDLRSIPDNRRRIPYMVAYGAGPVRLGRFSSDELMTSAREITNRAVTFKLDALEKAIQTRIDEEGCGAVFASLIAQRGETTCGTY